MSIIHINEKYNVHFSSMESKGINGDILCVCLEVFLFCLFYLQDKKKGVLKGEVKGWHFRIVSDVARLAKSLM